MPTSTAASMAVALTRMHTRPAMPKLVHHNNLTLAAASEGATFSIPLPLCRRRDTIGNMRMPPLHLPRLPSLPLPRLLASQHGTPLPQTTPAPPPIDLLAGIAPAPQLPKMPTRPILPQTVVADTHPAATIIPQAPTMSLLTGMSVASETAAIVLAPPRSNMVLIERSDMVHHRATAIRQHPLLLLHGAPLFLPLRHPNQHQILATIGAPLLGPPSPPWATSALPRETRAFSPLTCPPMGTHILDQHHEVVANLSCRVLLEQLGFSLLPPKQSPKPCQKKSHHRRLLLQQRRGEVVRTRQQAGRRPHAPVAQQQQALRPRQERKQLVPPQHPTRAVRQHPMQRIPQHPQHHLERALHRTGSVCASILPWRLC